MTEPETGAAPTTAVYEHPASRIRRQRGALIATPPQMLQAALERGIEPDQLRQLMDLNDRWEATQARKAFDSAIAEAKAEIKPILKNRQVDFANRNAGGRTQYAYEDLAAIADHVDPILSKFGLSYRHRPRQEGTTLFVTCILSHRDGHSEETTLFAPYDTSGNKNPAQAIASAGTFLQRYTLKMALGLAAAHDDDGRSAGAPPPELIGPGQLRELKALIEEHRIDLPRFLASIKAESLEAIPAEAFETVKAHMLSKRQRGPQDAGARAKLTPEALAHLRVQCDKFGIGERAVANHFRVDVLEDLMFQQLQPALAWLAASH